MTPRERAEALVSGWSQLEWPTVDRLISRLTQAIEKAVEDERVAICLGVGEHVHCFECEADMKGYIESRSKVTP